MACFNEAVLIKSSLDEVCSTMDRSPFSYELIIVDDASRDLTADCIKEYVSNHPDINAKVFYNEKNMGRGATVREGIRMSCGEYVGFLDVDMEVSSRFIPEAVSILKDTKTEVVIADRICRPFPPHRYAMTRAYRWLVQLLLKTPSMDTEAGFKFFHRETILPIIKETNDPHWFWDTEISISSLDHGLHIHSLPVPFIRKPEKKSTVHILPDSFKSLVKLFKYRNYRKRRQTLIKQEQHWKEQPHQFAEFYKKICIFSPKQIVTRFLNSRTEHLQKLVKVESTESLLDVGCGSGVHMKLFANQCKKVTGVDHSKNMIEFAEKELEGIDKNLWELHTADADRLPVADNSFDWVIAMGLLDYVSSAKDVLKECRRVIKPEGHIVITIPKTPSIFSLLRTKPGNFIKKKIFDLPPVGNAQSRKSLLKILAETGFHVEDIRSIWTAMWIIKAKAS